MSDYKEIACPSCSQLMRFKKAGGQQLALTCPTCSKSFQIRLTPKSQELAQAEWGEPTNTIIATPIAAPVSAAPIDDFLVRADFSRPIISTRPKRSAAPSMSPIVLTIVPLSLVGLLLLMGFGYWAFTTLRSSQTPLASTAASNEPVAGRTSFPSLIDAATPIASDDHALSSAASQSSLATENSGGQATGSNSPSSSLGSSRTPSNSLSSPPALRNASQPVDDPTRGGTTAANPATAAAGQQPANESRADVIERAEKSVIRIEVSSSDGDSLGSGFVIDQQGTFVTNCHVLAGASSATAFFPDGRSSAIAGTFYFDESRDIVIGKLAETNFTPIGMAKALPRKGEQVTALGAPHGLAFTATNGIVSALRPGSEISDDRQGTWIQVDAAISPGNSGGPLINASGEVVAMSTLASQGDAQNLNFGISGQDISEAIVKARSQTMLALANGVGKVKMHESDGGGKEVPIPEATIEAAAFEKYIDTATHDFKDLLKNLRNESTRMSMDLKEMRKGKSYMPPALQDEDRPVARVEVRGQRAPMWYFQSDSIKQLMIQSKVERIKLLTKLKEEIRDPTDPDSLYSLLWNYGPPLNVRQNHSIGYAEDIIVLHAIDEHGMIVVYDSTPFLLWAPSTTGMSAGEVIEGPVYVAGTQTGRLRSGVTMSLTVLQVLSEEQLREAIANKNGGYRVWKDRSGSFSVEAKLLRQESGKAHLQKRDGTDLPPIPAEKLSDADQAFLKKSAG